MSSAGSSSAPIKKEKKKSSQAAKASRNLTKRELKIIQREKYEMDLLWKTAQAILDDVWGNDMPKLKAEMKQLNEDLVNTPELVRERSEVAMEYYNFLCKLDDCILYLIKEYNSEV